MKINKTLIYVICGLFGALLCIHNRPEHAPSTPPQQQIAEIREGTELPTISPELIDVQVPIEKEDRIFNKTGMQCGWCSLETLGRYNKIESLYDLTDKQKGPIYFYNGTRELSKRNVKYCFQQVGDRDTAIFKKYVSDLHYGAAVGLTIAHMIVMCHFDEDAGIVKVIDNCGPKALEVQTWPMDYFMSLWSGEVFVVIPDDKS